LELKEKVIQAQRKILDGLAECEEAVSKLYGIYARILTEDRKFWEDLSREETGHANILRAMHKQLDQGHIFQNIGRFTEKVMQAQRDEIKSAIASAERDGVSDLQAMETALAIESSILDSHFFDTVTSDSKEYQIIAEKLSADTARHQQAVRSKLQEIQQRHK